MSTMPAALAQYIAVRRALGAKLREPAVRLREFVDLRSFLQFFPRRLSPSKKGLVTANLLDLQRRNERSYVRTCGVHRLRTYDEPFVTLAFVVMS